MNSEDDKTEHRIVELEKKVAELSAFSGGILSNVDLRKHIVSANKQKDFLDLFKERAWMKLKEKFGEDYERMFVIEGYNKLNFTPFSYDLSLGEEVFSIQKPEQQVWTKKPDEPYYKLEPGETVVVITQELIAIPPAYSATVWPRFNFVREGIFQSMVKIDPTWYGKLAVAMSNISPATIELFPGKAFATLLLYELSTPSDVDLWKHDDIKNLEVDVPIPSDLTSSLKRFDDFLFDNSDLRKFCRLQDNTIKINGIKRNHIETLLSFDKSDKWKTFVDVIADKWTEYKHPETHKKIIVMEALGMEHLWDIVKDADYTGRIRSEEIQGLTCSSEELSKVAEQYGKPFDLIARIPQSIINKFETETMSKIQVEIENSIFPKVITLMFSVLGLLSLIVAILALSNKLLGFSDLLEIPLLMFFCRNVFWGILIVTAFSILLLIFSRRRLTKNAFDKKVSQTEHVLLSLNKKVEGLNKTQDKLKDLQKELNRKQSELIKAQKELNKLKK
ncbi:MAG: hypothetical protein KJ757_03970 [Planctomycetes bacterium]|nr:hypothetical protein [Planctomycetota bacterium]MBU1517369.1 hypothetical protein [Planctomycetota bacterium]MBU2457672.1 hypothetical protein [Planctomycetota bacterium]MBU2596702.1 hypothetical protein [Planctomycetota bacterium]